MGTLPREGRAHARSRRVPLVQRHLSSRDPAALPARRSRLDLLTAIAAQETGHIWGPLRDRLSLPELLEICVGDTLDADKGRRAFPKTKADLVAVPRGEEMFDIAHEALVQMAKHVPAFAGPRQAEQVLPRLRHVSDTICSSSRPIPTISWSKRGATFDASLKSASRSCGRRWSGWESTDKDADRSREGARRDCLQRRLVQARRRGSSRGTSMASNSTAS